MKTRLSYLFTISFILLANFFSAQSVCENATLQLTGSGNPALVDPWLSSDVSIATVDATGLVTGVLQGNCDVTYTDEFGATTIFSITVEPIPADPTISASGSTTFCNGDFVTLTSSSAVDNIWSTGETTQDIIVSTAGNYNVTVITNSCSSNASADEVITVINGITIAQGTTNDPSACGNTDGDIEITGTGTGDLSYTGALTGTDFGVTLPYVLGSLGAGNYNFTFNDGCNSNTVSVTLNNPGAPADPTISTSGPTTFCDGGSVTLTSSSAVDNFWSTGETTQSIIVTTSNTYSVLVSTAGCSSNQADEVVTVVTGTTISQGVKNNPSACGSSDGDIEITGTGFGDVSYTGTATGTNVGVTLPYVLTNLAAGSYDIIFNDGCNSNTLTVSLSDPGSPATPTISTSGPTTFCTGDSVLLISSAANNNIWSTGETNDTIVVYNSGNYSVYVSNAGCTSGSSNQNVTVNTYPAAATITVGGPTTFCQGGNVQLTSSANTGNLWSNGSVNKTITVATNGNFFVKLTNMGCVTNSDTIRVNAIPYPATPVISSNNGNVLCSGKSLNLTSSANTNNNWSSGQTTKMITVSSGGTFTVTVDTSGCTKTSAPFTVTVTQSPPKPIITASSSITFCEGDSVVLNTPTIGNFIWSTSEVTPNISVNTTSNIFVRAIANGCTTTSDTVKVKRNLKPLVTTSPYNDICNTSAAFSLGNGLPVGGNYYVNGVSSTSFNPFTEQVGMSLITYVLIDDNGCSDTISAAITVNNCVGLEENSTLIFSIYPNPASSILFISSPNLNLVETIEIYDELGRKVKSFFQNDFINGLDLSDVSEGLYVIRLLGEDIKDQRKIQVIK